MIVVIHSYPNIPLEDGTMEVVDFTRIVDCDTVLKTLRADSFELEFYRREVLLEGVAFTTKARVDFLDNGRQFDHIEFMCN